MPQVRVVIDTAEIRNLAKEIRGLVSRMVDLLNDILRTANRLVTTFNMIGQAINNFLSNIQIEINIVITRACEDMRRYCDFLDEAADAFDETERAGVQKAESLGSTVFG